MLRRCAKFQLPPDRMQFYYFALRRMQARVVLRPNLLIRTYAEDAEDGVDQWVLSVKEA
jgi:hypothetical protein